LNKETLHRINLDPQQVSANWNELKAWILELPLPEVFTDMGRLKIFVENFLEYFREYDVLKDCTAEEYQAVLYYFAKTSDENSGSLRGTELNLIIRTLSKIRESA
jgi:hypothetical protein